MGLLIRNARVLALAAGARARVMARELDELFGSPPIGKGGHLFLVLKCSRSVITWYYHAHHHGQARQRTRRTP